MGKVFATTLVSSSEDFFNGDTVDVSSICVCKH